MKKLVFNTSACFGNCPIYKLQINNDKTFLLYKEVKSLNPKLIINEKETVNNDYYKGILNNKEYAELLVELKKTDNLKFEGQNCCDAPLKTIIAYYNGKRKYVKTMFPPKEAEGLISLLYKICESKNLTKSKEKFEIEEASK